MLFVSVFLVVENGEEKITHAWGGDIHTKKVLEGRGQKSCKGRRVAKMLGGECEAT